MFASDDVLKDPPEPEPRDPDAPLLAAEHAIVLSARVAFCGDYVDGGDGRAASVEGAALSGLQTADALVAALGVGDSDRCDGGRCAVL